MHWVLLDLIGSTRPHLVSYEAESSFSVSAMKYHIYHVRSPFTSGVSAASFISVFTVISTFCFVGD